MNLRTIRQDAIDRASDYLNNLALRLQDLAAALDAKAAPLEDELAGRRLHATELRAAAERCNVDNVQDWQIDALWRTLTERQVDGYIARATGRRKAIE